MPSLTIGGTNSTFYSGDIHYIPVSTPATALDWIIPCDGIVLNGNLLPGTRSNTVDIDTYERTLPTRLTLSFLQWHYGHHSTPRGRCGLLRIDPRGGRPF